MDSKIFKQFNSKFIALVEAFETFIYIILTIILLVVSLIATYRVFIGFFDLIENASQVSDLNFENFQDLFGKVLTLLIVMELKATILHAIKKRGIRTLLLDIILISGTAIARKLITMDYIKMEPETILAISALLISIGISYFLIKVATFRGTRNVNSKI